MSYRIGIDEVGRGPIAGPVVVCACAIMEGVDVVPFFPKGMIKDSKKLSEKSREEILRKSNNLVISKSIVYGIGEVSASRVDEIGISASIQEALLEALKKVHKQGVEEPSFIYLDGSLFVDKKYQQETIIKGDEKVTEIALASIFAKVYRDNYMKMVAEDFKEYGFENHAGYGTRAHYKAIKEYGITPLHRKSFLKKLNL